MAATAMGRKSVTDLTRRKGRAFFTVLTLAIAVASIGIFAVPSLLQQAMDREIASTRLADLTVTMNPLVISDAQLRAVARVPNVAAVQPKSVFSSRVYVGARRQKAVFIVHPGASQKGLRGFQLQGVAPCRYLMYDPEQICSPSSPWLRSAHSGWACRLRARSRRW